MMGKLLATEATPGWNGAMSDSREDFYTNSTDHHRGSVWAITTALFELTQQRAAPSNPAAFVMRTVVDHRPCHRLLLTMRTTRTTDI